MSLPSPEPGQDEGAEPGQLSPDGRPPRRGLRDGIPIVATLKEAWALIRTHPRTILLPLACISVPLAIIVAGLNTTLFLTAWKDKEVVGLTTLTGDTERTILFVVIVMAAVEALFAQVARGATIIALAGVVRGKAPALTEALDPAFTRIGGLLVLIAVFLGIFTLAFVTVVGLAILPYVVLRLALAFDAYMLEGLSPWKSLMRSWDLMRGNMLRLGGLLLLAVLCSMPAIIVVSLLAELIDGGRTAELVLFSLYGILQSALLVPVVGFFTACTTLYYFKTRAIHDAASPA